MATETPIATKDTATCPFCGYDIMYDVYLDVDGFKTAAVFCNTCKAIFTQEGIEDLEGTGGKDFQRLHQMLATRA